MWTGRHLQVNQSQPIPGSNFHHAGARLPCVNVKTEVTTAGPAAHAMDIKPSEGGVHRHQFDRKLNHVDEKCIFGLPKREYLASAPFPTGYTQAVYMTTTASPNDNDRKILMNNSKGDSLHEEESPEGIVLDSSEQMSDDDDSDVEMDRRQLEGHRVAFQELVTSSPASARPYQRLRSSPLPLNRMLLKGFFRMNTTVNRFDFPPTPVQMREWVFSFFDLFISR